MEIIVACPKCNYQLHLPNRELLGRKGKCPGCQHKFIMVEPKTDVPAPPKPASKPEPPAKKKLPAEKKPQPKPREEPWEQDDLTVYSSGKTHADPSPLPAPLDSDFLELQDQDEADDGRGRDRAEAATLDGSEAGDLSDDSELVPDEIWEDMFESPSEPALSDIQPPKDVVARCPNCHAGADFRRDDDLRDFLCPHCETSFSLIHPESPPQALAMPDQVGTYTLQKQPRIGIGPFGNVYRGKDGDSQQSIVIKVSRGDQVSPEEMPKFLATLRSVMQLKHPNIASLRELDETAGRVYLVSSFVSGIDLSEYLVGTPGRKLTIRETASLCALVASVLHHAHKFGVVHGNLKPTNIRLDGNQKPYLIDFGLANRQASVQPTGNGRVVGTAAYLAPEQLPGNRREPDAQTDVYALGVIFYELLTGRRPFPGQGAELFKQIAAGGPAPPRSINSQIPKPLDTICMKCLEADPRDRYQSAMDVYKELRLYLEDKPIQTKPPGMFTRFGRWCRRRPLMAGMLLTFLFLTIAGAGFIGWRIWQEGGFS